MNFSIRTATDPDAPHASARGIDSHDKATLLFSENLQVLCEEAGIYDSDHERAPELYSRAAFDTALELGVELVQEDVAGGIEFTFNFVPTIIITEVAGYNPPAEPPMGKAKLYIDAAADCDSVHIYEVAGQEEEDEQSAYCECGAGRRGDGTLTCADPSIIGYSVYIDGVKIFENYDTEDEAWEAGEAEVYDGEVLTLEPIFWTPEASNGRCGGK